MKKLSTFILAGLLVCALLSLLSCSRSVSGHICADRTHVYCDGGCECDGLGCPQPFGPVIQEGGEE